MKIFFHPDDCRMGDRIALGTRMFDRSNGCFGLFVSDGSARFRNIRLLTE